MARTHKSRRSKRGWRSGRSGGHGYVNRKGKPNRLDIRQGIRAFRHASTAACGRIVRKLNHPPHLSEG